LSFRIDEQGVHHLLERSRHGQLMRLVDLITARLAYAPRAAVLVTAIASVVSVGAVRAQPSQAQAEPPAIASPQPANPTNGVSDAAAMNLFLDRLMIAESGGRDDARNPRSTAVGPFQFIESTFLEVARRHFADEVDELTSPEILRLRTNRAFSRRAAEAFTRDNAAHLAVAGIDATFPNLRLAYLVGPGGAVRVLKTSPDTPVAPVLGGAVVRANPFLSRMTTGDLIQWSARNLASAELGKGSVEGDPSRVASRKRGVAEPSISVRCNRALASCQKWVALAKKRLATNRVAGTGGKRTDRNR